MLLSLGKEVGLENIYKNTVVLIVSLHNSILKANYTETLEAEAHESLMALRELTKRNKRSSAHSAL